MPSRRPLPAPLPAEDGTLLNAKAVVRTGILVTELRSLSAKLGSLADELDAHVRDHPGPPRQDGAR